MEIFYVSGNNTQIQITADKLDQKSIIFSFTDQRNKSWGLKDT